MKFNDDTKEALYLFMYRAIEARTFPEVYNYIAALKDHSDYRGYFDNAVKSIQPLGPETDREIKSKYSYIRSNLAIVAGAYYGRDLSLKHIKRDYSEEITANSLDDEALRQEVMTFTRHLLFGEEASGVANVGDLQIEQEGLVPMMSRIMTEIEGDAEQKHELMKHFRVYGLLSEQSLKEASEAAQKDPHLTLLRNTLANRSAGISSSASLASASPEVIEEDNDSKELDESKSTSFVEQYANSKKPNGSKKTVGFASDL